MSIQNIPGYSVPSVADTDIRSGEPIKGRSQWLDLAEVANYLNASEISLAAATSVTDYEVQDGISGDYVITFQPRDQSRTLLWVISFSGYNFDTDDPFAILGTVQIGSGTTYSFYVEGEDKKTESQVLYLLEERADWLSSDPYINELHVNYISGSGADDLGIRVDQIAVYQVKRYGLDPDAVVTEHAADSPSCNHGALIMDNTQYSINGVVDGLVTAKDIARRASMFAWVSPASGVYVGQGSAWNNLFHNGGPEVLARYVEDGITTVPVNIAVVAMEGNGNANAQIRFVANSGDSATITVPDNAPLTLYTTTVNIWTEDPSAVAASMGRRHYPTYQANRIQVQVYGNGNSGAVFAVKLYAITIGED